MQIYINIQPQVNDRSLTLCSLILQKYKGIKHKLNEVVTCGAGPVLPSVEPQFSPVFCEVSVLRSLVFCVMLSRYFFLPFALFIFAIVLYILLRCTLLITPLIASNFS